MIRFEKSRVLVICLLFVPAIHAQWEQQRSGTLSWLRAVYFLTEQKGWAAGSSGAMLSTTDAGKTWKKIEGVTRDNIREIYFADDRSGWILCERDRHASGHDPLSYLMKTSDGGATWSKVDLGSGKNRIARVFVYGGRAAAVGEGGFLFRSDGKMSGWEKASLPERFLFLDGVFTTDLNGILVGGGGTVLLTEDGGKSWSAGRVPDGGNAARLNAVHFADEKNGWAVGSGGGIYSTSSGGKEWSRQVSSVPDDLLDVEFRGMNLGLAAGDNGVILRTEDAGRSWRRETSKSKLRIDRIFLIGKSAFAVGFGGTILRGELE